jgi:hypothetical protein
VIRALLRKTSTHASRIICVASIKLMSRSI